MLAVDQLDELAEEMVFLGGCATGLLASNGMDSSSPYKSASMRQNGSDKATIQKMRRNP